MEQEQTSEAYYRELAQAATEQKAELEAQVEQLIILNFVTQMVVSGRGLRCIDPPAHP